MTKLIDRCETLIQQLVKRQRRDIIGYSYSNRITNQDLWYKDALSFHESSKLLHASTIFTDPVSSERHFRFNAGLSLELILKAILAKAQVSIDKTHDLRVLSNKANVKLDADQIHTLDFLTEVITWLCRYPAPLTEEMWDRFLDEISENQRVRARSGNTWKVMLNQQRFPSMENYMKIWEICLGVFHNI